MGVSRVDVNVCRLLGGSEIRVGGYPAARAIATLATSLFLPKQLRRMESIVSKCATGRRVLWAT